MRNRIKYKLLPVASLLPECVLRWVDFRTGPRWRNPADGWSFWTDASYWKWVRIDRRKHPDDRDTVSKCS